MNRIKKALEKCRTYVAVQKFGCGMTGIGHGVEDNILQFLNEADEELARLEKREPTLMSDCISAGLPLDVALKYDVQLCRLTNYVRDKTLADCVKQEPVAWINEDELPEHYPYEEMFNASTIIDGVRMFPNVKMSDRSMFYGLTKDHTWLSVTESQFNKLKPEKRMKCYLTPVDVKAIRAEALEEAAKVCRTAQAQGLQSIREAIEEAIRGLK